MSKGLTFADACKFYPTTMEQAKRIFANMTHQCSDLEWRALQSEVLSYCTDYPKYPEAVEARSL